MADIKPTKSKIPGPMREDELLDLVDAVMEENNPYHIPPELIPDGYSVEYKVVTVMGARAPNQDEKDILHAKTRWEVVHLDEHPGFKALVPSKYDKNTVERGGMILMIRSKEITEKVLQIQRMKAEGQLNEKLAQLSMTKGGEAPRKVLGIKRSYEPTVEVPD